MCVGFGVVPWDSSHLGVGDDIDSAFASTFGVGCRLGSFVGCDVGPIVGTWRQMSIGKRRVHE